MDNHRTDIKAASSHHSGTRLISEEDLASVGLQNNPNPSPSSRDGNDSSGTATSDSGSGNFIYIIASVIIVVVIVMISMGKPIGSESSDDPVGSYSSPGISEQNLSSHNSSWIAPEGEFQLQATFDKAISLIPGYEVGEKLDSFGFLTPQAIVEVLGKASSGEATYSTSQSTPFLIRLDYRSKEASIDILLEELGASYKISSLSFQHLKSEKFADKNGSLTKDDFANIQVGMPYLDLLNTVGIPDDVYVSGLSGYGEAPTFTYRLSDAHSVLIHFDSQRKVKDVQSKEEAATPASSTSTVQ